MGKKQNWLYKRAKQQLDAFENEMKDEFLRREWQFIPIVLPGKYIMFRIERLRKKIVPVDVLSTIPVEDLIVWSSVQIIGIVDFDIELDRLREFIGDPNPSKQSKAGQDVTLEPSRPLIDELLLNASKATESGKGLSM